LTKIAQKDWKRQLLECPVRPFEQGFLPGEVCVAMPLSAYVFRSLISVLLELITMSRVQGHDYLVKFPPQPEDAERAEEGEEANPLSEEEEGASDGDAEDSVPAAESGEEDEGDAGVEVSMAPGAGRKRRATEHEGDATDAGASSEVPLVVEPLRAAPPAPKRKKYVPDWCILEG
jgi:pyruvate/2-oxoglutarate dehydrogenase complex dihydrolipoamide acyltransferase (E2) component